MAANKSIVELGAGERARLDALFCKGKAPAKLILKARIWLQADVAEGGPDWQVAQIVEALDTKLTMVSRVRDVLVIKGSTADAQKARNAACSGDFQWQSPSQAHRDEHHLGSGKNSC